MVVISGNWWLRSANTNASNPNNTMNVNSSGNVNNNNAYNSNGVAPIFRKEAPCRILSSPTDESGEQFLKRNDYPAQVQTMGGDANCQDSELSAPPSFVTGCGYLNQAFLDCRKGKNWKESVQNYSIKMCRYNYVMHNQLLKGTYKVMPFYEFDIYEPKERHIHAPHLRDRIVQRCIVDNYIRPVLSPHFVKENCACLPKRGCDYARELLKEYMRRYYRLHKNNKGFALRIDVQHYFASVSGNVLGELNYRYIPNNWVRIMMHHYGAEIGSYGLGLGCETNQYEALLDLHPIDTFCKYILGLKYYVRYMDDIIIILETRKEAAKVRDKIDAELHKLELSISRKKTKITRLEDYTSFLGFRFRLTDSGKALMQVLPVNTTKERKRLPKQTNFMNAQHLSECYQSWRNHALKGSDYYKIKRLERYFMNILVTQREKEKILDEQIAKVAQMEANLDYVAMMTDVDIDTVAAQEETNVQ